MYINIIDSRMYINIFRVGYVFRIDFGETCLAPRYFFKVFEYIPDLVPSYQKSLVKKISAQNNCHFIKITISGGKTTIFYLLGTYNERSFIL